MSWLMSLDMPLEVVGASVETLCRLGRAPAMKDTQVSCSTEVRLLTARNTSHSFTLYSLVLFMLYWTVCL